MRCDRSKFEVGGTMSVKIEANLQVISEALVRTREVAGSDLMGVAGLDIRCLYSV